MRGSARIEPEKTVETGLTPPQSLAGTNLRDTAPRAPEWPDWRWVNCPFRFPLATPKPQQNKDRN